jgi:hypothetical protein
MIPIFSFQRLVSPMGWYHNAVLCLNDEQMLVRIALLIVLVVAIQMHNVAGTSATPSTYQRSSNTLAP